jgi:broad specificity phosphatase PhoE
MRTVEHRRHSVRNPANVHLSREGIALARRVAPSLRRFDRVVASPKPRAVETVEALGLTLDATVPDLAVMPDDVGLAVDALAPRSFADYVRFTKRSRTAAEYALRQSTRMREELEKVPEEGRLLMVSHAGIVEFAAAAARPKEALSFGSPAGPLEGVRLVLDRGEWVRGEVLRVPK